MKILIAPDKFKGSLDAKEVCDAIVSGVLESDHRLMMESVPLADGGEGTCNILTRAAGGMTRTCETVDPLGRKLLTSYGISSDKRTAYIEIASASGLHLLSMHERNPMFTSTFGTGLMIRDALQHGATEIVLGVGGSCTNDGGIGMAAALGFRFLDQSKNELAPSGAALSTIHAIEAPDSRPWTSASITVLCDVSNPLFGEQGAAYVFAPQKGAGVADVGLLDSGLRNLASVVTRQWRKEMNFEGAGAGGGIAGGAGVFLDGRIVSGIHYVMSKLAIDERVRKSDLVITGEGKLDSQSLSGKLVAGISEICRRHAKPFVVFCGRNELTKDQEKQLGAVAIYSLAGDGISAEEAMAEAASVLRNRVRQYFRENSQV